MPTSKYTRCCQQFLACELHINYCRPGLCACTNATMHACKCTLLSQIAVCTSVRDCMAMS